MEDSRYYFLLGFMSAMLFATVFVGCTAPLEAGSSECHKVAVFEEIKEKE